MWSYASVIAIWLCALRLVEAQLGGDGCSICPSSLPVVGLPDVVLPVGTAGFLTTEQTCAETEELAQSGAYSQAQCVLLRASGVSNTCGCEELGPTDAPVAEPVAPPTRRPIAPPTGEPAPAPTDPPVAGPTEAPVDVPVDVPIEAPVVAPSEAPEAAPVAVPVPTAAEPTVSPTSLNITSDVPSSTPSSVPVAGNATSLAPTTSAPGATPTQAPIKFSPVSGSVSIRLQFLYMPWTDDSTASFLAVCEDFYEAYLPSTVSNVTCALSARRRDLRKYSMRALQANQTMDIATDVSAMIEPTSITFNFQDELISTLAENPDEFIELLQTSGDATSQIFFKEVTNVTGFVPGFAPPVGAPVAPPVAAAPTAPTAPVAAPTEDDDSLSKGALAGIAIGVAGGIGLLLALFMYAKGANPDPQPRAIHTEPVGENFAAPGSTAPPVLTASSYSKEPAPVPVGAIAAGAAGGAAVAAAAMGRDKDGSVVTGSEMDAYSLDAGNVDQQSSAPGTKRDTVDGMSQSGDEMSSHAMSSLRQNMISRTVIAPPGKLGIVIDTTLEGPVVHKINPSSPLEGSLFPGDIIVAIDDVDTRAMSASAITALMVRTANLRRKLTVLSEDVTN